MNHIEFQMLWVRFFVVLFHLSRQLLIQHFNTEMTMTHFIPFPLS